MPSDEEILAGMVAKDPELAELSRRMGAGEYRQFFVDDFPLHIIQAVVYANALFALPLVMAAHRLMRMRNRNIVRLSLQIWQSAGYSFATDRQRRTAIEHVRKIPEVLILQEKRT